ncbi:MAG: flagellar filament capping protein FliD, partial [Azoarcus sp.]|nr:flagellar filament capping protein FliD [Azoarcus sp.]
MALTANGIGSGLDINGILEQLMAVEQRPLQQLAVKEASYQAQLSAFGQVKSVMSTFQNAADALNSADRFSTMRATSSDSSAFSATAETSAAKGSYSFEVEQIAQGQRIVTNDTTEPSVGPGSLTINFGSYDYDNDGLATAFNQTSSVSVELEEGDTLEDLRDAINASGAGVRASVVDNGTAKQLVIAGSEEGADAAFTLEGTGGLTDFSYDATDEVGSSLTSLEVAQDAIVRLDGITLTRGSNTITNAIEGVTINLLAPSDGKGTLTVANDRAGAKSAIDAFVKAYNEINTTLRGLTA